jgi:hypothetical protein
MTLPFFDIKLQSARLATSPHIFPFDSRQIWSRSSLEY